MQPLDARPALRPEQLRALAYAKKRGTLAPVADIRARVTAAYGELAALIEPLSAERARQAPADGGWSVQEVVDHLLVSDRPALDQLAALLAGRDAPEPIPASLQSVAPLAQDWSMLRQNLRNVHEGLLELLARASDDVPLTAKAAVVMVVKCKDEDEVLRPVSWVERFDWKAFAILLQAHTREHISQIHRVLGVAPA